MNPHKQYEPGSLFGTWANRGTVARTVRRQIAGDRRYFRARIIGAPTLLAYETFGTLSLTERRYFTSDTDETQARKVDALYRAHLLRAAAERIRSTPAAFPALLAATFYAVAARAQEIRADHTGNDAAARVAVLIERAR